jgi:hypothetical protein
MPEKSGGVNQGKIYSKWASRNISKINLLKNNTGKI